MQEDYNHVMEQHAAKMFQTDGLIARQVESATKLKELGVKPQPVPGYISAEMRNYANMLYKKGVKTETIKRKVCEKFNVTIIPA